MRRGLLPLLAAVAVGCGGTNPGAPPQPAPTPPGQVDLQALTPADFAPTVAAHKGKVVYVDCWFLG